MPVSYKNVLITPNIGSTTADPTVQFAGGNTSANTDVLLRVYPLSNGTVSFEGTAGQLFSITNDMANVVFSVGDISGIPLIQAFANNRVSILPITNTLNINATAIAIGNSASVIANGSSGSAGQVLTSNSTGVYWSTAAASGVTQVNTGVGMTGGPITSTGTVSVLANSGIVANATGVFVNTAFIGTLTANNSTNFNSQPASFYANATNLTSGTLDNARLPSAIAVTSVNAAALTVGSIVVANTTGITTSANISITSTGELLIAAGAGIQANGSFGTGGQVLSSNGSSVYWATASGGGRIDPRVSSTASAASVTPDISSFDMYVFTALATNLTINATTSGSPLNGNKLTFRFKDNGTSRGLTWTTAGSNSFRAVGVTLPTSTTINKVTYVGCIYNADESFWDVVAVLTQA